MTGEVQRMIRGAIGALLVGLEPIVFLVCGVYAGMVYGGIVGALHGAREQRLDSQPAWAPAWNSRTELVPAMVRSRVS